MVSMLNRVAVLSDIHGVLPALEAVLAEPEVSAADRIVLTGDITAGPQPTQVLDRLTSLGDRVVWITDLVGVMSWLTSGSWRGRPVA